MCTGDNILTGISVARECSMINRDAKVKILKFVEGTGEIDEKTPPNVIYGGKTPDAKIIFEELEIANDDTSDFQVESEKTINKSEVNI